MKKRIFLLALMALAGLSVFTTPSEAAGRALIPITWKTSNGFGGYYDSAFVMNGSGQSVDTTAAFRAPSVPNRVTASAADSISWFSFIFAPSTKGTGTTAGADSIYLSTQVSWDGANWATVTPGQIFIAAGKDDASFNGIVLLEPGSKNAFYHQFKFRWVALGLVGGVGEGATTAPTHLELGVYPYFRFLVQGDWTGAYEGKVEVYGL